MVDTPFAPELAKIGSDGRITLPQAYCDKLPWVRGEQALIVWLLMLLPGRFRLLSDAAVLNEPKLAAVRAAIVNGPTEAEVPAIVFDPNEQASLVGRLIPTTLSPPRPSWRLVIPKPIIPSETQHRTSVILFSLGFVEIWFLETYNAALARPLDLVI
jgi:hypothetical protein